MRFRRRSNAPPEPEAEDEAAWARPDGEPPLEDAALGEATGDEAPAEPEVPEAPVYEPAVYEVPEEPVYEPAVYEVPEEPYAPPPEPRPEPAVSEGSQTPAPVSAWSGGPDDRIPGAEGTVRAAGGVVWSRWQGGLRVVLVHRPRYDDWSLPKGKAGPGESDAECALREVREETGLACSLGEELGTTTYRDRHGRLKTVRYFAMQPLGGGEAPQHEVDEIRWMPLEEARRVLSYDRDVGMLDALEDLAGDGVPHRQEFGPPPE